MKKIIYRKLALECTKFFVLVLFTISIIIWVLQAVNFLDFVTEDGHGFLVYFNYTLLSLPKIVGRIYPYAIFLSFPINYFGAIITLHRSPYFVIGTLSIRPVGTDIFCTPWSLFLKVCRKAKRYFSWRAILEEVPNFFRHSFIGRGDSPISRRVWVIPVEIRLSL